MGHDKNIEEINVGWSETVVMVCTRCGEQFRSQDDQESPERIKKDLKSVSKEKLGKTNVRVITTSCLNICPENKIGIAVASKNEPGVFKAYAVDPEISGEDLFDEILKK